MRFFEFLVLISTALQCKGVSYPEQLDHIAKRRLESLGIHKMAQNNLMMLSMRRFNPVHGENSVILGAPSRASHLPEAEPILPAHTLIRPAIGMLKSAIKFPHKDLDNGAGVYGSMDNIGLKYDGRNERVMYSGFRRMPSNYIMVPPIKSKTKEKLRIYIISRVSNSIRQGTNKTYTLQDIPPKFKNAMKDFIENLKKTWNKTEQSFVQTWNKVQIVANNTYKKVESSYDQALDTILGKIFHSQPGRRGQIVEIKDVHRKIDSSTTEEDLKRFDKQFMQDNPNSKSFAEEKTKKLNWFGQSKNFFHHVKLDMNAPEHSELIPDNVVSKMRNWWFFHQDDFEPFIEIE